MPAFPSPQLALVTKLDNVLAKRGLTKSDGIAIGLTIIEAEAIRDELKFSPPFATWAQKLPYFDIDGHEVMDPKMGVPYCRYRLEYANLPKNWDKPIKYAQPIGSSGHICYLPREVGVNWLQASADPVEPILFTEGEYKSISGCKAGIATVGLAGIHMIAQDSRAMPTPIQNVSWVNRPTPICFDAHETSTDDEPLRPEIELKAAKALANKLSALGANPTLLFIARTPTYKKQEPRVKMGLDDFLQAGGTLDELFATKTDVATEDILIAELCRDYCICLASKPFVMDRHRPQFKYTATDFNKTVVADKKIKVSKGNGDFKMVPAGEAFIGSKLRPTFRFMRFDPENEFGLNQDREEFNTWKGMATKPDVDNFDVFAEDVKKWRKYLEMIAGQDWEDLEKFAAHLIQRPGERPNFAIVLSGKTEGTGKTTYGALLGAMVGESYRSCDTHSVIFGPYSGAMLDSKLIIQVEESEGLDSKQMASLKNFITSPRVDINIKHTPNYSNDNLARVIVTSNSLKPVKVEETSRRFMIMRTPLTQEQVEGEKGVRAWVGKEIYERFVLDKSSDGEQPRKHLMYHLMNVVKLGDWDPKAAPPVTEAMEDMIEATSSVTDLGLVEMYALLDKSPFWILPSRLQTLNSHFWNNFMDYLKSNRGGIALRFDTRVFGSQEIVTVRVLATAAGAKNIPVRRESKGGGKFREFVAGSKWNQDEAALIRAKNDLIEAFEKVAPILRLSDEQLMTVRAYGGANKKF